MSKILLTVTHQGGITPHVCEIRDRLIAEHPEIQFVILTPRMVPYENAMNHSAAMMRSDASIGHWLHMDHDNPLLRDPIPLLGEAEFIGFPTPMWRLRAGSLTCLNIGMYGEFSPDVDNWTGMKEVGAIGSGSFLMARSVVEKIKHPFERLVDEFGRVQIGADVSMCRKIHAAGIKTYAHFDYPCDHIKDHISLFHLYVRERWGKVRPPVIVVGTGRSGTSTVAKHIASTGVYMGEVDKQHGECQVIKRINDARICGNGPAEWTQAVYFQGWIRGRNQDWGFKDPRVADFMSEYVQIFPNATFIRCIRDRSQVIESLQRNYGFSKEMASEFHDRRTANMDESLPAGTIELPFASIIEGSFRKLLGERLAA
jgi:hypothetical protein